MSFSLKGAKGFFFFTYIHTIKTGRTKIMKQRGCIDPLLKSPQKCFTNSPLIDMEMILLLNCKLSNCTCPEGLKSEKWLFECSTHRLPKILFNRTIPPLLEPLTPHEACRLTKPSENTPRESLLKVTHADCHTCCRNELRQK